MDRGFDRDRGADRGAERGGDRVADRDYSRRDGPRRRSPAGERAPRGGDASPARRDERNGRRARSYSRSPARSPPRRGGDRDRDRSRSPKASDRRGDRDRDFGWYIDDRNERDDFRDFRNNGDHLLIDLSMTPPDNAQKLV